MNWNLSFGMPIATLGFGSGRNSEGFPWPTMVIAGLDKSRVGLEKGDGGGSCGPGKPFPFEASL